MPRRVYLVGAPGSWKTGFAIRLACDLERSGVVVGILAVDEDGDDIAVRLAQCAGFPLTETEQRKPATVNAIAQELDRQAITIYDAECSIEAAAADLRERAGGKPAAFIVDSLHTVRSKEAQGVQGPREIVEANVRAIRYVSTQYDLLTIVTTEANRATYRDPNSAINPMAAGAESRAIEFSAQTLIRMRSADGGDIVEIEIVKNRRGQLGRFWLKFDRERHFFQECDAPSAAPNVTDLARVEKVILDNPGIGASDLRTKCGPMASSAVDNACKQLITLKRVRNEGSEAPRQRRKYFVNGQDGAA